jgi:tetratricopeptide (TPR) repeat protein
VTPQDKSSPEIQRDRDAMIAGRDVNYFWATVSELGSDSSQGVLHPPVGRLPESIRGRGELLELLRELVRRPDGRVHVLAGLGGTGKSTVALAVADWAIREGHDVWWITATDPATVNSSLLALASHLGASADQVESALHGKSSPYELLWACLEARTGWVLILDRADDPLALRDENSSIAGASGWIRGSESGLLLITTRSGDPRAWGRGVALHHVGWLSQLDGARLLMDLAPDAGPPEQAARLSASLGGLPLALQLAGAYLARERDSFASYAGRLSTLTPADLGEPDDRSTVSRACELSLDLLDRWGHHDARAIMESLCWFAGGTPLPASRLEPKLLVDLLSISLIAAQADAGEQIGEWIVVHPLAAQSLRLLVTENGRAGKAAAAAVNLLRAQTDDLTTDDKEAWYAWLPHVESMLESATARLEPPAVSILLNVAARLTQALSWADDYMRLDALVEIALSKAPQVGREDVSVVMLNLAKARGLEVKGDLRRAETLTRDVVETLDRLLGPDHPDSQSARFDLARILRAEGRLPDAEALLRAVSASQREILGAEHPRSLQTLSELADVLIAQDHYAESEPILRQLYEIQVRNLGAANPGTVYTLMRLGTVYIATGRSAAAGEVFGDARHKFSRLLGPADSVTLDASYGLAVALAALNRYADAQAILREMLDLQGKTLNPDDPRLTRITELQRVIDNETGGAAAARE